MKLIKIQKIYNLIQVIHLPFKEEITIFVILIIIKMQFKAFQRPFNLIQKMQLLIMKEQIYTLN